MVVSQRLQLERVGVMSVVWAIVVETSYCFHIWVESGGGASCYSAEAMASYKPPEHWRSQVAKMPAGSPTFLRAALIDAIQPINGLGQGTQVEPASSQP